MKMNAFQEALAMAGLLALLGLNSSAQDVTATPAIQHLPYGAAQILQLQQAQVGDDTMIEYIKTSGNGYQLDANQIIYLKQQGVSITVLSTMMNQPKPGVAAATISQSPPAMQSSDATDTDSIQAQPPGDSSFPVAYAPTVATRTGGSVTILPAIHAAAPPAYCYDGPADVIYIQTVPFYSGRCNYTSRCAPARFASIGFGPGCSGGNFNRGLGFNNFGRSYIGGNFHGGYSGRTRWHR